MRKLSHDDLRSARDQEEWNTLWLQAIPLVKFCIKQMMAKGEVDPFWAREDLLQEGMLAAGLAVRSWDTIEGAFSSWITLKVRGHLINHLNEQANGGIGSRAQTSIVASLHERVSNDGENEITRLDELAYGDGEVFAPPETAAEAAALRRLMSTKLTTAEADVVTRTFGLGGAEPQSEREVADYYGVGKTTLRYRLKKALSKLDQ